MNPDKLRYLTRDTMRMNEEQQLMNNSFTDLAAVISRIPTSKSNKKESHNDIFEGQEEDEEECDDEDNGINLNFI